MSAEEIIKELPKLTDADRRRIRMALLNIANENQDIAHCNESALETAQSLDQLEEQDAQHPSR
jgi:hypothetical protein